MTLSMQHWCYTPGLALPAHEDLVEGLDGLMPCQDQGCVMELGEQDQPKLNRFLAGLVFSSLPTTGLDPEVLALIIDLEHQ